MLHVLLLSQNVRVSADCCMPPCIMGNDQQVLVCNKKDNMSDTVVVHYHF